MFRHIAPAFVLAAAGLAYGADSKDRSSTKPTDAPRDCSFGTALEWEKSFDAASEKAENEHKLLMVLAVAGHFEDPFFT
jgi:hypothetical protein